MPNESLRTTAFSSASAFLDAVRPVLAEHEAEHHLVLGVAEAFRPRTEPNVVPFAVAVEDGDGLALAAWMAGSRPLLLASDRPDIAPAAAALCDALRDVSPAPRRVIGKVGQVAAFVDEWARRTGVPGHVVMRQRVYRLDAVAPVPTVPGSLRAATADDLELVVAWMLAFEEEALGATLSPVPRAGVEARVAAGEVYLWCDPEPRTMAGSARPTTHGVAVNAVYTPREWRRRGYATACVAELSRRLLASGFEFCVLYTDLANPTSNAIYARIGYRPVRDFLMYSLT